jgi:hypothetical protein
MPSKALVANVLVADMRHGTCVKAVDVSCAKPCNATGAKAADVTATKATDVASAKATHTTATKAAHVASTAHATAVAAATTTAASGLCARGKQASGQHYACQGHYHSPFHDILHSHSADFPPRVRVRAWRVECQARDRVEVGMLSRLLY